MRAPIQIFKKNGIHYYENDENEIEIAMQQYADEFACGFAEWKEEEKIELSFRTSRKGCIYVYKDMAYTTIELLEIYKQQINGKV